MLNLQNFIIYAMEEKSALESPWEEQIAKASSKHWSYMRKLTIIQP